MRFLFVYQDYAIQARNLLDEVGALDVELIIARKGAVAPAPDDVVLLEAHVGAEAAACELNRHYRKSAERFVRFTVQPKKFRFEDVQLREWLVPPDRPEVEHKQPSEAFLDVVANSPNLILHPDALRFADEMAEHRWPFANNAAALLGRYAQGDDLGPARDWKANHGVDSATGGQVRFRYEISTAGAASTGRSYWHLKAGDNTTRESAARIYFERVVLAQGAYVIVFYVGPHPDDGERVVYIKIEDSL